MKIAYLGAKGLPAKSGVERVLEALVERVKHLHQVVVYCDARYTPEGTSVEGIRLIRIQTIKGKHLQPLSYFIASALHAVLFGNYDLIHLHSVEACFVLPLLDLRYRVVATAHGSPTRAPRSKWGFAARFLMGLMEYPYVFLARCATSVSNVDADYYKRRYAREVSVIPNGVDAEHSVCADEALLILGTVNATQGSYLLFAAGRIDPTKGCHLLLEAYYKSSFQDKLLILGDLDQVPEYGRRLTRMADNRVCFLPVIADKDTFLAVLGACKIFVFPSLSEAMSMTLLEAASLAVPIVCSDIPENRWVLGETGCYFRSGDPLDLAYKLQWAHDHLGDLRDRARDIAVRVSRDFSWDRIAKQYMDLYEYCVGKSRNPVGVQETGP